MIFSSKLPVSTKKISCIVFDFGGVIIDINYRLTANAFEQIGVKNFDMLFSQANQLQLFDLLETGRISPSSFRDELRLLTELDLPNELLDRAWNAMLIGYPRHRLDMLSSLKGRFKTFLLSNTNQIHMDCYLKMLEVEHGIPDLKSFFDKLYFSHQVGMRKPGSQIYQLVLDENGLNPEETLFIDDSYQNLEAPAKLGMQVYHLCDGEDIADALRKLELF